MDRQFSIKKASDRLGIPKSTLRYWEKEFNGFIAPQRTPGGQRRYSETDMKIITSVCKYKKMGFSINQIREHFLHHSHSQETFVPFEIDQLADRIANTVRREIHSFFNVSRLGHNDANAIENQND